MTSFDFVCAPELTEAATTSASAIKVLLIVR
jgi:hypothetical protein